MSKDEPSCVASLTLLILNVHMSWILVSSKRSLHSLGRADVKLRDAKGKIAENTVYACALLSAHADAQGTKGKKRMIFRMSDQANVGFTCNICIQPKKNNN